MKGCCVPFFSGLVGEVIDHTLEESDSKEPEFIIFSHFDGRARDDHGGQCFVFGVPLLIQSSIVVNQSLTIISFPRLVTYFGTATTTVVRYSEFKTQCCFFTIPLRFLTDKLPLRSKNVFDWSSHVISGSCYLRLFALKSLKSILVLGIGVQLGLHDGINSIDFLFTPKVSDKSKFIHGFLVTWFKVAVVSCNDLSVRYFIVFHWKPRTYWSIDSIPTRKKRQTE